MMLRRRPVPAVPSSALKGFRYPPEVIVVAVHDTKESWEKFRDGTLNPKMQEGIDGGFASQPEETAMDLYTVLP